MKTENTLRLAILRNLTIDQQRELSKLITTFAIAAKEYGIATGGDTDDENAAITRANNAYSALLDVGLNIGY